MAKRFKKSKTYKNLNDIKTDIYNKAVCIYGKDIFIAQNIIGEIVSRNFKHDLKDMNVKTIDGKKAEIEDIINEINTMPVFDTHKLIIIKDSVLFEKSGKRKNAQIKDIINNLDDKPPYLMIVFLSHDMPYWSGALIDYFKENNSSYEIDGCEAKDEYIIRWVINQAAELDLNIDQASADYLLSYIGYYNSQTNVDAQMLYNELYKLSCFCADSKTAGRQDIKKVCASYMPQSMDILIAALNAKNLHQAALALNELLKINIYPTVILNSIVTNFNIMLLYKQYSKTSKPNAWDMLAKIKKLQSIKYANHASVDNIIKNSASFSEKKIKSVIYTCAKYDNGVKSGIIESKIGLERILYFICT